MLDGSWSLSETQRVQESELSPALHRLGETRPADEKKAGSGDEKDEDEKRGGEDGGEEVVSRQMGVSVFRSIYLIENFFSV